MRSRVKEPPSAALVESYYRPALARALAPFFEPYEPLAQNEQLRAKQRRSESSRFFRSLQLAISCTASSKRPISTRQRLYH